jgi:phosphatidylinositol-3-phosphatase
MTLRAVAIVALGCVLFGSTQAAATPIALTNAAGRSAGRSVPSPVVVIVMENHSYDSIMKSSSARYFRTFAKRGVLFTRYHALHHPSLPNYLEMTSGTTSGCTTDGCPQKQYTTDNLFRQLSHAGVSWRAWQESMDTPCRATSSGRYVPRHNPPLYYRNLFPKRCPNRDLPLPRRLPATLPAFVFLTPNLCHDMHDCSIATGNAWLHDHARKLLRRGATVVVVFDEGTDSTGGGGHVYAAVAGAGIRRGVRDAHAYSHWSLLAGLERHFGLRFLHGAKRARPLPI